MRLLLKLKVFSWHPPGPTLGNGHREVCSIVHIRTVADILGHKNIRMTMRYGHLARSTSSLRSSDWPDIIHALYERSCPAETLIHTLQEKGILCQKLPTDTTTGTGPILVSLMALP